jgi:hypothetical protein
MTGIFSNYFKALGNTAQLTTFAQARRRGPGLELLQRVIHNLQSEQLLAAKANDAIGRLPAELLAELRSLQARGETPDRALMEKVKNHVLSGNRLANGEVELLGARDYFALTPFTPTIGQEAWGQDQILAHDASEVRSLIDEGNQALTGNEVSPGMSTAVTGLPAGGIASRAATYARQHPDLVAKLDQLGGLEGLGPDELPPRLLYPIRTDSGIRTLIGLMLQSSDKIGRDLNALIPSLLMIHPQFAEMALARLDKESGGRNEDDLDSIGLFTQSMARRVYLTDREFLSGVDPTGSGDYANALARYDLLRYLADQGFKYLAFSNADEIMWSPNPFMIGIAQRLIRAGYAGIVFVVPNTNNQSGGGAVKKTANPQEQFICEMPCLPANLLSSGKYPLGLNTTFFLFSLPRLAGVSDNLATISPALDLKTTRGRQGGDELALTLESWAYSEFSNPRNRPDNYRVAFIFAPRPGFFTGIKTLEQSHSETIPPELKGDPVYGSLTYERYIQHLANIYPRILSMMTASDPRLMEPLLLSGGSYLLDV